MRQVILKQQAGNIFKHILCNIHIYMYIYIYIYIYINMYIYIYILCIYIIYILYILYMYVYINLLTPIITIIGYGYFQNILLTQCLNNTVLKILSIKQKKPDNIYNLSITQSLRRKKKTQHQHRTDCNVYQKGLIKQIFMCRTVATKHAQRY